MYLEPLQDRHNTATIHAMISLSPHTQDTHGQLYSLLPYPQGLPIEYFTFPSIHILGCPWRISPLYLFPSAYLPPPKKPMTNYTSHQIHARKEQCTLHARKLWLWSCYKCTLISVCFQQQSNQSFATKCLTFLCPVYLNRV